jgi:hypothetical protein
MVFKNIEYMNGGYFENLSGMYRKNPPPGVISSGGSEISKRGMLRRRGPTPQKRPKNKVFWVTYEILRFTNIRWPCPLPSKSATDNNESSGKFSLSKLKSQVQETNLRISFYQPSSILNHHICMK